MALVKLNSRNQIVIPKEAREAMKLESHDELLIAVKGDAMIIMPKPKNCLSALSGIGKGICQKTCLQKESKSR